MEQVLRRFAGRPAPTRPVPTRPAPTRCRPRHRAQAQESEHQNCSIAQAHQRDQAQGIACAEVKQREGPEHGGFYGADATRQGQQHGQADADKQQHEVAGCNRHVQEPQQGPQLAKVVMDLVGRTPDA